MRWKSHVRFGGRAGETHPTKDWTGRSGPTPTPTWRPAPAGSTWRSSSTSSPAGSSAGRPPSRCAPSWPSTPWRWPSGPRTSRPASTGSCITPTAACNTCRSATPNASPTTASSPRSAHAATPTTTPWPRAFIGLYKMRTHHQQGPWRTVDDVEFATLGYVDWFNHRRLHGEITDDNTYVTPAEYEATTTVKQHPPTRRSPNRPGSHQTRGDSVCARWPGCRSACPGSPR